MLNDPFETTPVDWTLKGLPSDALGRTNAELGARGLSLFSAGLFFPVAVLREDIVEANSAWMMRFVRAHGIDIAPHGKTTMAPALMALQLRDGAWGLTAATVHHVRAYRTWGAKRIILANQLVDAAETAWLAGECARDPSFEFYCLVDSVAGARLLADNLAAAGMERPLKVLLEIGIAGGRTGVRSLDEGVALAGAIAGLPELALAGIETFEGLAQSDANGVARAQQMLDDVVALAQHCEASGLFANEEVVITGGGSGLFDLAATILSAGRLTRPSRVVMRSGCYLIHDDHLYRNLFARLSARMGMEQAGTTGLESALRVWARVLSQPEPGRLICGLGRRDVGADSGLPVPLNWVPRGDHGIRPVHADLKVAQLFDQHALVDGPADGIQVGDLLSFGISHPCTTLDKWRALLRVDADHRITGLVRTYF